MTQIKPAVTASSTGKWKAYPAYKDSGVEWLGEIPVRWDVRRLKYLTKDMIAGPFGSSLTKDLYTTEGYRVYGQEQVIPADFSIGDYYIPEDLFLTMTRYAVNAGDVLVSCVGTFGKVAVVPLEVEPGIINPRLVKLVPNKDVILPAYLGLLLRSQVAFEQIEQVSRGGTMGVINLGLLSDLLLSLPSLDEQRTIATYLDCETARINALIAKKEQLIELLQEKRSALISHAVTKGLDPTVPMKDSGIDWLGEIPTHWEVRRMKFAASFFGGGTPSKENLEYWSGDIPWVSPKDMKTEIIHDAEDHITKEAIENSSTRLVQPGAVLIVVRSGILKHSIPVAINVRAVALNQDMKAIVPQNFLKPEYLASVIRGHQSALLVEWRKEGATVESIEYELLVNTLCPIPPLSEQHDIVDYLKSETAKIDALITRIGEGIEKLKEYNSALISAAVTGKIDVMETIGNQAEHL